jgi:hypothetical protein
MFQRATLIATLIGFSGCFEIADIVARAESRQKEKEVKEDANAKNQAALSSDCPHLIERYAAAGHDDAPFMEAMARKYAACGKYDELFEQVAHWGNENEMVAVLTWIGEGGAPLAQAFRQYMATHSGASFMKIRSPEYAMSHIVDWLIGTHHTGLCEPLRMATREAQEESRAYAAVYFKKAKCDEAQAAAVELLRSDHPGYRVMGCEVLETAGEPSVLRKVDLLAHHDPYYEVNEEPTNSGDTALVKLFPVRDACATAGNKIRLR